jgi:hypothetical protein
MQIINMAKTRGVVSVWTVPSSARLYKEIKVNKNKCLPWQCLQCTDLLSIKPPHLSHTVANITSNIYNPKSKKNFTSVTRPTSSDCHYQRCYSSHNWTQCIPVPLILTPSIPNKLLLVCIPFSPSTSLCSRPTIHPARVCVRACFETSTQLNRSV